MRNTIIDNNKQTNKQQIVFLVIQTNIKIIIVCIELLYMDMKLTSNIYGPQHCTYVVVLPIKLSNGTGYTAVLIIMARFQMK